VHAFHNRRLTLSAMQFICKLELAVVSVGPLSAEPDSGLGIEPICRAFCNSFIVAPMSYPNYSNVVLKCIQVVNSAVLQLNGVVEPAVRGGKRLAGHRLDLGAMAAHIELVNWLQRVFRPSAFVPNTVAPDRCNEPGSRIHMSPAEWRGVAAAEATNSRN